MRTTCETVYVRHPMADRDARGTAKLERQNFSSRQFPC